MGQPEKFREAREYEERKRARSTKALGFKESVTRAAQGGLDSAKGALRWIKSAWEGPKTLQLQARYGEIPRYANKFMERWAFGVMQKMGPAKAAEEFGITRPEDWASSDKMVQLLQEQADSETGEALGLIGHAWGTLGQDLGHLFTTREGLKILGDELHKPIYTLGAGPNTPGAYRSEELPGAAFGAVAPGAAVKPLARALDKATDATIPATKEALRKSAQSARSAMGDALRPTRKPAAPAPAAPAPAAPAAPAKAGYVDNQILFEPKFRDKPGYINRVKNAEKVEKRIGEAEVELAALEERLKNTKKRKKK